MSLNPYESPQSDPQLLKGDDEPIAAEHTEIEKIGQLHYLLLGGGFLLAWAMTPALREAFELRTFSPALVPLAFQAVLAAAPLAAVALAIWRRHERANTFPAFFGHWLLLVLGTVRIAEFIASTGYWRSLFVADENQLQSGSFYVATYSVQFLAEAAALVVAGRYSRGQTFWRAYAAVATLRALWILLSLWILSQLFILSGRNMIDPVRAIGALLGFLTMLTFLIAAVRDIFWYPRGKDPLHWLGIGLQLLVFARPWLEFLWYGLR